MVNGNVCNFDSNHSIQFHLTQTQEVATLLCDVILAFIAFVGILSNTCVCLCICRNRHLRTYLNVNIVSSCIGNITGCIFLLPIRIELYTRYSQAIDISMLCRTGTFFRTFCDILQLFMFTTASVERYQAVANPFQKSGLKKRAALLVILSWTMALTFGIISAVLFIDSALYMPCSLLLETGPWTDNDTYLIAPIGLTLICIIIALYTLIVKILFKHSDIMSKYTSKNTSKVAPGVSNVNDKVTLQLETRETVVLSHSQNGKQHIRSESSEILRKKASEEHKIVPVSACDLRGNIANSSTGSLQQRKSASLPASAPTSCKHTVQVVAMDGSVKITKTSNERIAGAVCLMTTNNRKNGRRRVELRASKKIAVLIGTFLCCWLPLPVFTLFYSIGGQTTVSETSVCLLMVLGTVGCTSLAINPILLGVINRQLNSALKGILKLEKITRCKK